MPNTSEVTRAIARSYDAVFNACLGVSMTLEAKLPRWPSYPTGTLLTVRSIFGSRWVAPATWTTTRCTGPTGTYYGLTVRTYDPKTGIWSIWWHDGRTPRRPGPAGEGALQGRHWHLPCRRYSARQAHQCATSDLVSLPPPPTGNRLSPATAARPGRPTGPPTSGRSIANPTEQDAPR